MQIAQRDADIDLRYKAFDGNATRFYFVPVGKDGMPIIVDAGGEMHVRR